MTDGATKLAWRQTNYAMEPMHDQKACTELVAAVAVQLSRGNYEAARTELNRVIQDLNAGDKSILDMSIADFLLAYEVMPTTRLAAHLENAHGITMVRELVAMRFPGNIVCRHVPLRAAETLFRELAKRGITPERR